MNFSQKVKGSRVAVTSPDGILILIDETMKPPALRLAAIKESSSNLMKCYEESEEQNIDHYCAISKSMVCPCLKYHFFPFFHLRRTYNSWKIINLWSR